MGLTMAKNSHLSPFFGSFHRARRTSEGRVLRLNLGLPHAVLHNILILNEKDACNGMLPPSMPRKQIAQFAQRGGDVKTRVGQRLARQDLRQRRGGVVFTGQQHVSPALAHMADKALAGAAGHHQIHPVQRVRGVVLEVMHHLLGGQLDQRGRRQQLLRGVAVQQVKQPVARLAGVAGDAGVVIGGNGDFHGRSQ